MAFAWFRQSWACGWKNWWAGGSRVLILQFLFMTVIINFKVVLWWGCSFQLLVWRCKCEQAEWEQILFQSKCLVWESAKIAWWILSLFPFCGRLRLNLQALGAENWTISSSHKSWGFSSLVSASGSRGVATLSGHLDRQCTCRAWAGDAQGWHGSRIGPAEPLRMRWGFPTLERDLCLLFHPIKSHCGSIADKWFWLPVASLWDFSSLLLQLQCCCGGRRMQLI